MKRIEIVQMVFFCYNIKIMGIWAIKPFMIIMSSKIGSESNVSHIGVILFDWFWLLTNCSFSHKSILCTLYISFSLSFLACL
jgi:hypothetical protein